MSKHHFLKIETEYFQEIVYGHKKFELRKNDRDFKVGDTFTLREVAEGDFTGRQLPPLEISYVFKGGKYGLEEGYCIFNW